jgi:hypothetical protein
MLISRFSVSTISSTETLSSTEHESLKNQAPADTKTESLAQSRFPDLKPRPLLDPAKQARRKAVVAGMRDEGTPNVLLSATRVPLSFARGNLVSVTHPAHTRQPAPEARASPSGLPANPKAYLLAAASEPDPDQPIVKGRVEDWVRADRLLDMHKGEKNADPSVASAAPTPPRIASKGLLPDAEPQHPVEAVSVPRSLGDFLRRKRPAADTFDIVTPLAPRTSPELSPIDWRDEKAW